MSSYKFTLPYPPSINGYWRTFRNRQIISKRGRDYVKSVGSEMLSLGLHSENIDYPVNFRMVINPPTLRSYDVDNFTKGVFDALSKCGFWVDDSQVQKLTVIKGEKVKGGNVEIVVDKSDF
ncbi:putative RusA-like endodeoxyribonuclease [Pseudoalteromonas virus vB_PspP-H6/1]|nr:putative RusA-like endodeoxyribonuclease [Pseudoalteromonas virus vB_PspP-H6/1]